MQGLKWSQNAFRKAIRNPVYCGKILLPAYEGEDACYVEGLHEPLISVEQFNQVQKVNKKRKYKILGKDVLRDQFPFRGFLKCPVCGKILTGSRSTGQSKIHYHYYHCSGKCKVRFRVELVEEAFLREISKYSPLPEFIRFFRELIRRQLLQNLQTRKSSQQIIVERINDIILRIHKAEELMLEGDIDSDDYQRIKEEGEKQINILGRRLPW